MKASVATAMLTAASVSACAQVATQQTATNVKACLAQAMATPDGELVYRRVWRGDGTDTASKLSDPNPLTPPERDALLRLHAATQPCRQMILDHDRRFATWETPYWQVFFATGDGIRTKLAAGEISVGAANKMFLEAYSQFQVETSKGQAQASAIEQQQRAAALAVVAEGLSQAGQNYSNAVQVNAPRHCNTIYNGVGPGAAIASTNCY